MPLQVSVENNFTGGLKTEFTGLNFPENSATDTDNCVYDIIGNVTRRLGFDFEDNYIPVAIDRASLAISTYKWKNAGGDGSSQLVVQQVGGFLYFYVSSLAQAGAPVSNQFLSAGSIALSTFIPAGGFLNLDKECTFTDGNGYLFVFHPDLDPIYVTYNPSTFVTAGHLIDVKIRDFTGVIDGFEDSFRPVTATLDNPHKYNIYNQGWYPGTAWSATSITAALGGLGNIDWTIQTGLTISVGQIVTVVGSVTYIPFIHMTGAVVSYNSGTGALRLNITSCDNPGIISGSWTFSATASGIIETFHTAAAAWPSNSDVWWLYKNSSGVFSPGTTLGNVSQFGGPAPRGRYIFSAFNQDRTAISSIPSLTVISTLLRPRIGAWFQGRVWYAGVDANFATTGTAQNTSWSETIYFSQIIEKEEQFGRCYQTNDPTSEDRFDLLPSDGGTIRIQGCGKIFKLFPVQNGLLIHCANGIWFLTGSQGIGFLANDYTITKVSGVECSNTTSFVSVQGWPMFWNDEGIYFVQPEQSGSLSVQNICIGTIWQYFREIPLISKKHARGDYDPINFIVQWCFRSTNETTSTDRYDCDRILSLNLHNKAFYPYSITGTPKIHDILYIQSPGGSTAPEPVFKYLTSYADSGSYRFTFSEEKDTDYVDWDTFGTGVNYNSYFITGYKPHGQAQRKWQPVYVYLFSNNEENTSYKIQGHWDYAISGNSGRFSSFQLTNIDEDPTLFGHVFRRYKIRGNGVILQFKVTSVDGEPFDIQGWSILDSINQSV